MPEPVHYVVIVRPSAAPKKSFTLLAERYVEADEVVRFYRDDAVVYIIAAKDFARADSFATDKAAKDHLAELRARRHGAASIHVDESSAPAPRKRKRSGDPGPGRGAVAEGISFRIQE